MIQRLEKHEAMRLLHAERQADAALAACAMCRLLEPDRASLSVAESVHGVVVLDEYAAAEGHLLVIARRHVESHADLPWPVYSDLARLVWEASRAVDRVLVPERVYTATLGSAASLPMSYPHFHTHVIPVYDADERARPAHVFSWSSGITRYDPGEAERLADRLRIEWPHDLTRTAAE